MQLFIGGQEENEFYSDSFCIIFSVVLLSKMMEKTIDIEKILAGKMGDKARFVPHILVSWLKRVVHEDEVNKYLWESRHLSGTDWLEECVRYLRMTLKIEGLENLPDKNDGRLYTFFSNHPLGGADDVA